MFQSGEGPLFCPREVFAELVFCNFDRPTVEVFAVDQLDPILLERFQSSFLRKHVSRYQQKTHNRQCHLEAKDCHLVAFLALWVVVFHSSTRQHSQPPWSASLLKIVWP